MKKAAIEPAVVKAKPLMAVRKKGSSGEEPVQAIMLVNPQALISQAIAAGTSVDGMERLLAMRRELRAEWARGQYFEAMARFQKACPVIEKMNRVFEKNSTTKVRYRYASLDDIISQVRDLLEHEGFSYRFETKQDQKSVTAICISYHKDGHSEKTEFTVPVDPEAFMTAPQKQASALTFAKRYSFCNSFGIATGDEDDDAGEKTDISSRQDAVFAVVEGMIVGKSKWKGTIGQWVQRSVVSLLGPNARLTSNEALDRYEEALKAGKFDLDTAALKVTVAASKN